MSEKKVVTLFTIISLLIFGSRWITSFNSFDETISVKIIFESITDGYYYFPLVKYLSIFDFNNSFSPNYLELENLMIPFYSVFVHSIFYKFIGSFSFIIIEYFSILIFLFLIFKIFKKYYSTEVSILFSLIVFSLPVIFSVLPIFDLTYFRVIENSIYSLRFPRPLITTLYLFFFLYLIVSFENSKNEFISKKNFFLLGAILAATLSSFYFFFFIQVSILFLFFIYKFRFTLFSKILNNLDSLIILILTFAVLSLPLILNIFFNESDYSRRLGIIDINFEQKKVLLKHYLNGYLKKEFLIFLSLSSIYIVYLNNKKILNYRLTNLFYLFFLGSALAPIIFILITNKTGILYHYNNTVNIFAFLLGLVIAFEYFNIFAISYFKKIGINFCSIVLIITCVLFNFNKTLENSKNTLNERSEFNEISNLIQKNYDLSNSTLMTFDNRFMVWSVLNNIKYLNLTNFIISPKKDEMIENDLIQTFKFLDLNAGDFSSFIANKKTSWRYMNYNLSTFFFYKYIANPIKTFNNSSNFDDDVLDYIKKSSPINFEQSVIPNGELERLNNKFLELTLNNFNYPDIIILNKKSVFLKNKNNIENYCKVFDKNFFIVMFEKETKENCQ